MGSRSIRQPPGRLDQLDRTRVRQHALGRLEHPDVGQRAQDVCPHGRRNPFGATGFDEYHVVDQQGAAGVVPGVGRRLGEELPRRQVPVGRIGCGLEEFAQQHVGIHARGRLGQVRRCRPFDGADGLRGRRAGYAGTAGEQHGQQTAAVASSRRIYPLRSAGSRLALTVAASGASAGSGCAGCGIGFMGSGLVVTLWPRTSGSVSRKQAPSPGSPHASSRPWCSRASSTLIARPSPVPPERRTRDGSERQNRLNTSFSSPGRSPTP